MESAVNTVNKRVIGYLAEDVWMTLAELNEAIAERVWEINHDIRRADGTTRFERFTEEEATVLSPLPDDVFEQVEWKELKVGRNYHVTADYQHYSVPYALAGRLLRMRLTGTRVTVFDGQQVVAEHLRKMGRKGQYSTDPTHVPHQHRNVSGLWRGTGSSTGHALLAPPPSWSSSRLVDRRVIEAQGYLDCQNILESLGKKNKQKLEAACQDLVNMRGYPSYSTLKRLMAGIESDRQKPAPVKPAASNLLNSNAATAELPDVYVRGADYYREGQ
ncbi:Mu transposase domain-containing protein [Arthrobacter psychrolactophilus]